MPLKGDPGREKTGRPHELQRDKQYKKEKKKNSKNDDFKESYES